MIIGENFNSEYNKQEDHYDYLFKRKAASPQRQPKTAEKKQKNTGKKLFRKDRRQDRKASVAPKKRLIMGNFGMFNKNKKKEAIKAAPDITAKTDADSNLPTDEMNPIPDGNTSAPENTNSDKVENASEDTTDLPAPEEVGSEESNYDEPANTTKQESKKTKEGNGLGAYLGFAFIGATAILIGVVLYRIDKMEKEFLPVLKKVA